MSDDLDRTRPAVPPAGAHGTRTSAPSSDTDPGATVPRSAPPGVESGDTRPGSGAASAVVPPGMPAVPGFAAVRELARGGMGAVYLAHDPAFDRPVAVKVMHPGQDPGQFLSEARITGRLPHPGVPPVYALGELPDGRPFLAMKLIEGRTLADELRRPGRAPGELLGAFERICETVGYAHARGVIHRDLKPSNVMVGAFGEVQVMDWGLAKEVRGAEVGTGNEESQGGAGPGSVPSTPRSAFPAPGFQATVAGQIKGTPAYMAPEQARGEPVDARADVFALGGVLAAVLTGKAPFGGTSVMDTVLKAAQADLGECFARLDGCGADPELVALAKRCLAARPADRYASGEEVAVVVAAYRRGVQERLWQAERDRETAAGRASEQRRQRRRQSLLIGVMTLAGMSGYAGQQWYERREEQREAARELAVARADADLRATEARLDGERRLQEAERQTRAAETARGVRELLRLAADLRRQYKFREAEEALASADKMAAAGGADDLRPAVGQARADLALVVRLDGIQMRKSLWIVRTNGGSGENVEYAPPAYRAALLDWGFDPAGPDPAGAAARVAAAGVRDDLLDALDEWALDEPDPAVRGRLLAVARAADPGPWLDRFRDPAVRGDDAALLRLARDLDPGATRPGTVAALAAALSHRELDTVELLKAALVRHPDAFPVLFALGRAYVREGGRASHHALGCYLAARVIRPGHPVVLNYLGYALKLNGELDAAVVTLREAIRLNPTGAGPDGRPDVVYANPHNNLGWTLLEQGDPVAAEAAFREAVRINPNYAQPWSGIAHCRERRKDPDAAAAAYREAIRLAPEYVGAYNDLGDLLEEQEQYDEALAVYRAVRAVPGNATAWFNVGYNLKRRGDAGAADAYREAVRLDPQHFGANLRLGQLLSAQDPAEAVKLLRAAVRVRPGAWEARYELGKALSTAGESVGAAVELREAVQLNPRHAEARNLLAIALRRQGQAAEAVALLREAVRLKPGSAVFHSNLSVSLLDVGEVGAAVAAAREAVRRSPTHAHSQHNLGRALLARGDVAGARAALVEAARLNPKQFGAAPGELPPVPVAPEPRAKP